MIDLKLAINVEGTDNSRKAFESARQNAETLAAQVKSGSATWDKFADDLMQRFPQASQQALGAAQKLHADLTAAEARQTSDTLAEHTRRMNAVTEMERQAAKDGIDITAEAGRLRLAYEQQFVQQQTAAELDRQQKIARLTGNEEAGIRASYGRQIGELKTFLDLKQISQAEYQAAVTRLQAKADAEVIASRQRAVASAGGMFDGLSSKVTALATAWMAFGRSLASVLATPIKEAIEAESAAQHLSTALQDQGVTAADTKAELIAYADALERASGLKSESIQRLEATAITLKMNTDQTKALAEASTGLAKAKGITLEEASAKLIASLTGEARELKKQVQGVGQLTDAQLRHGEAIAIVQERYRKFITADSGTTAGAWDRIKVAIGNLNEAIGFSILRGVNLGAVQNSIVTAIEKLGAAVERNQPAIIKLADAFTTLALTGVEKLVPALEQILDKLEPLSRGFEKVSAAITLGQAPARTIVKANMGIVDSLVAITEAFFSSADDGAKSMARIGTNAQGARDEWQKNADAIKVLRGIAEQGPPVSAKMPPNAGATAGAPNAPKFGGFAGLGQNKGEMDAAKEAQRQLATELAAQEGKLTSDLLAEHAQRMAKVLELEQKAAKGGIDIQKQANELRTLYAKELTQKLAEEEFKRAQDGRKFWFEERKQVADAMNDVAASVRISYAQQLEALEDFHRKGLVSETEFIRRKRELDEDADRAAGDAARTKAAENLAKGPGRGIARGLAERGITHDDGTPISAGDVDAAGTKATGYVAALKGGVNEMVSKIGGMFGPWGQLVSSMFEIFNQTPDKFREMFKSILQSFMDAPKNIMANIPIFIAEAIKSVGPALQQGLTDGFTFFPKLILDAFSAALETLPTLLGKLFSAGFWGGIANQIYTALSDAFRNFWSVLFTGKPLRSALEDQVTAPAKREVASFGSDDPNAGGGEFKIKDANLRAQRKATQSFEESFDTTVKDGGKTFTDMLGEAFQHIIDVLGKWFADLPGNLMRGLLALRDEFEKLGGMMMDGFIGGAGKLFDLAGQIGTVVWEALKTLVANGGKAFEGLGSSIWTGLALAAATFGAPQFGATLARTIWDAFVTLATNLGAVGQAFGAMGKMIWDGFYGLISNAANLAAPLLGIGQMIWDGLMHAAGVAVTQIGGIGKQIWDGLTAALTSKGSASFIALGSNIYDGLTTSLAGARDWIGGFGTEIYRGFVTALGGARDWISGFGVNIYRAFVDSLASARDWIGAFGTEIYRGFVNALANARDWIKAFGSTIYDGLAGALNGAREWIAGIGGSIWNGLRAGILSFDWDNLIKLPGGGKSAVDIILGRNSGGMVPDSVTSPAFARTWAAMGAIRMAAGGTVPGVGFSDTVPALLTPGEKVLSRAQVAQNQTAAQPITITLNFNVAAGAKLDRDAIREATPMIVEVLNREIRNGNVFPRKSGVA